MWKYDENPENNNKNAHIQVEIVAFIRYESREKKYTRPMRAMESILEIFDQSNIIQYITLRKQFAV